ncbi:MAG: hypothetical protein [Caudoviricetes sp.]|nr:MAG: hypothetical protein [Caudoviricetes sp.]
MIKTIINTLTRCSFIYYLSFFSYFSVYLGMMVLMLSVATMKYKTKDFAIGLYIIYVMNLYFKLGVFTLLLYSLCVFILEISKKKEVVDNV